MNKRRLNIIGQGMIDLNLCSIGVHQFDKQHTEDKWFTLDVSILDGPEKLK